MALGQKNATSGTIITQEAGFGTNRLGLSFVEDKSGNLWIGTGESDSALVRYRDGQFKIFARADGVPEGWMRDLFVDHTGRLWIANPAVGLLRLDDVNADKLNFVRYTPAEGLSSIGVSCITEDEFGRIYIGTGRGLDRLNPETGQIENFTTADGLPNSFLEVAYRDRKNNLWFGTANGLARFVPEPLRQRHAPNIFIMGLRVSGVSQPISILGETAIPPLELDSDQRQMTVDFLGLGASLGEKLKYEYRFGEFGLDDDEWSERSISPISPRAIINLKSAPKPPIEFTVKRRPFLFALPRPSGSDAWFIAVILFLTASAIYLFYKYRVARLLEMERYANAHRDGFARRHRRESD